ncbi:virulence-associated protein VapD [Ereboglobus sp. PH5-10]|uniref:hypothetical protein n=1 Tax=Ereboglobus sp. PH5-10 TaxID=2940629 RepID=UPI0024064E41|nr:hypothetical protein [Ereboglobus sp. PH5-10]MDF9827949.1 virulence-associated protein VapD [Ereboglobus sp. PH5-10]
MPVVLSFDLKNATSTDYGHLQSMFERFGFENLGGSSYRYPQLGTHPHTEDWFNHVIPALMLFRSYAVKSKKIKKITLDIQTSTGYAPVAKFGTAPKTSSEIKFYNPNNAQFGLSNLKDWLDGVTFPYDTTSDKI